MKASRKGLFGFIALVIILFMVGSTIMQAAFSGVLMLIGLMGLVHSIGWLKWLVVRSTKAIDIIIFIASIIATIQCGITIAMALTIAGIGYTYFYAPYLRGQ